MNEIDFTAGLDTFYLPSNELALIKSTQRFFCFAVALIGRLFVRDSQSFTLEIIFHI